jgi:hypothetical protein
MDLGFPVLFLRHFPIPSDGEEEDEEAEEE